MDLQLKDKRVLVTGSSKGIGLAIARGFLGEGARVLLTSRSIEDLERIEKRLSREFPASKVLVFQCDFTKADEITTLGKYAQTAWGGLDILVANVGSSTSLPDPIPERTHFETLFRENFNVAVDAAREFLPLLKASKGNILFISSIAGMEAFGAPTDYSTAKTALLAFSKNLARKVAGEDVRVNCVAPGNVLFKDGTWYKKLKGDPERVGRLIETTVPMKRFGTPEEIASACLFLCSRQASFITGAVLCVDGGQTVTLF
jgi:3-oxoacyl-[acyl-carrier protein] reductase